MKKSKLEINIDILKVIAQKGPLKLNHTMYEANLSWAVLKKQLEFLIKQDLVERKNAQTGIAPYSISQRGLRVLKYFGEVKEVFPLDETEDGREMSSRGKDAK